MTTKTVDFSVANYCKKCGTTLNQSGRPQIKEHEISVAYKCPECKAKHTYKMKKGEEHLALA